MARLIALFYLLPLGFVDLRAIAQETAAQSPLGQAMESAALIAGQEKEANPGTAFKECDKGCPVMIVIPAGKFMLGSPENESERRSNRGSTARGDDRKAIRRFQVRGDIRRMGCLRRRGCLRASRRRLGTRADARDQCELARR